MAKLRFSERRAKLCLSYPEREKLLGDYTGKKDYLQPESRVLVLQYESVLAASPTPAPKVIFDFDEDDTAGDGEYLF